MPVVRSADATRHDLHGSSFHAYVAPSRGSAQLCAWRLDVPSGTVGVPHRPSREEVLLILRGAVRVVLDGEVVQAHEGDVVVVPAGAEFALDAGPDGVSAWVTTTPGLEATLPDGARMSPPWSR